MRPFLTVTFAAASLVALTFFAAIPAVSDPVPKPTLKTVGGLTYSEWLPADFATHHHDVPLIMFSHGFGGCAQQSSTLTQALADAGYAVLAPNHKDAGCERYASRIGLAMAALFGKGPDIPFGDDEKWNDTTEASRRDDVQTLLNQALTQAPYKDAIDPARIALMGHSLGGYTVLGLAGAWKSWREPRVKAVLALAPYAAPFLDKDSLKQITIPVMYQTGSKDTLIPTDEVARDYSLTRAPKYLIRLDGASHFSFTELDADYQATIARQAIAFFDHVLKGRAEPILTGPAQGQISLAQHAP